VTLSFRSYIPAVENAAVVLNNDALPNVTIPGPLAIVHFTVDVQPGRQAPLALPDKFADAGSVIV
jgi:hypothetical protein